MPRLFRQDSWSSYDLRAAECAFVKPDFRLVLLHIGTGI
jgi:hypothetical protein